jgi:hypothetical protein
MPLMKLLNLIWENKMKLLSLAFLLIATNVYAHGEGKLGPNGGYLKMPGTFHTEVVPGDNGSFHVFLEDIQFKNPTIKDSKVELQIKNLKETVVFNCAPMGETHFHCLSDKKVKLKGKLIVKATRLGIEGKKAIYDLPLRLKGAKAGEHDMSKDHDMNKMNMGK